MASAWARMLGGGSVSSAAVAGPLFSLVASLHGKARSAMVASLQWADPHVVVLMGAAYTLSLLAGLALARYIRVEVPREITLGLLLGHALMGGLPNILLLVASYAVARLTRNPSQLFGYIIVPTLVYYIR